MSSFCFICCWYDAYITFDDSQYQNTSIINRNCYNNIPVCYDCLLTNIYECNKEIKRHVLRELLMYVSCKRIQRWWKQNFLYNIDHYIGKRFILSNLSITTKCILNVH